MKKNDFLSMKNRQNHTFRVKRKEIFLNFPFLMWKEIFLFQFPFPHEEREIGKNLFPSHAGCGIPHPFSSLRGHSVYEKHKYEMTNILKKIQSTKHVNNLSVVANNAKKLI